MTSMTATYLLLVIRGLEFLALEEIHTTLKSVVRVQVLSLEPTDQNDDVMRGEAAVGKILLETDESPQQIMSKLRCVQAILAFLASAHDIDPQKPNEAARIAKLIAAADWEPALDLWRSCVPCADATPRFRGSCVRDGRHVFKSYDVAGEIGAEVIEKFNWKVDLDHFNLEVVCILLHNQMLAGISLGDPTRIAFKSRLANEDREGSLRDIKYKSTLRPSTAFMLHRLAGCEPGDVLLDSMCGVGTIPICSAQFSEQPLMSIGGEIDHKAVSKAALNASGARGTTSNPVCICRWDSTRLPLRDGCIDRVIIDMPFGVRCGNHRLNSKTYPKVIKELDRVLRDGGRAVLLAMSKKLVRGSVQGRTLWIERECNVNVGGLGVGIFILQKRTLAES